MLIELEDNESYYFNPNSKSHGLIELIKKYYKDEEVWF